MLLRKRPFSKRPHSPLLQTPRLCLPPLLQRSYLSRGWIVTTILRLPLQSGPSLHLLPSPMQILFSYRPLCLQPQLNPLQLLPCVSLTLHLSTLLQPHRLTLKLLTQLPTPPLPQLPQHQCLHLSSGWTRAAQPIHIRKDSLKYRLRQALAAGVNSLAPLRNCWLA